MKAVTSPNEADRTAYSFGDILLEPHNFRLLKSGQRVAIEPRAFEVLLFLIEHRDRVVEKQELFEQVWKQSFVTDSALAQEIKNIRHVIADDAHSPRYIETVHKHGYRFVGDILDIASALPKVTLNDLPGSAVAVLPLTNMSGDPENEYFCDGLSEELIGRLTKLKRLRVVAHTSSFSFKRKDIDVREIGRKLNAGTIVEGSVRRDGDRLRISVQIINAEDGYQVWSESYDRRWENLFAIQDEISLAIVDKLKVAFLPDDRKVVVKRYTENLEAYHLYLKGRFFWNQRLIPGALAKAIDYFQQAIISDPRYALPFTGLADAYSILGFFGLKPPKEVFPLAKRMVQNAFAIDADLAEAHNARACINLFHEYAYAAAELEFRRALELDPGYIVAHQWYSYYLLITGRSDEALGRISKALEVDPLSPNVNAAAGQLLCYCHRYEEAVDQLQRTLELEPRFPLALYYLAEAYTQQGKFNGALDALRTALKLSREFPWAECYRAAVYGLLGDRLKARKILCECEAQGKTPCVVAYGYLALGEIDKVFEWLEKGYEQREFVMPWLNVLPEFDAVRADSRFQNVLEQLGLPVISAAEYITS